MGAEQKDRGFDFERSDFDREKRRLFSHTWGGRWRDAARRFCKGGASRRYQHSTRSNCYTNFNLLKFKGRQLPFAVQKIYKGKLVRHFLNKKKPRKAVSLLCPLAFLLAFACGEKPEETKGGICSFSQVSAGSEYAFCAEYTSLSPSQIDAIRDLCIKDSNGLWTLGATCPRAGWVGSCLFRSENISFTYHYYPAFTAQIAEDNCTSAGGSWTL